MSLAVPSATTMRTFEVTELDAFLDAVPRASRGSLGCILAFAVARAARQVPVICSRYVEHDSEAYVLADPDVNLGVAVDAPQRPGSGRLVLTPVIRQAGGLAFDDFSQAYESLTARARARTLTVDEMLGPSLIVTNTAAFGSTTGVPRLPAGIGAVVAIGTLQHPPGLSRLALTHDISRIVTVSCTYDHRVIQGGDSGEFLDTLATTVQSPDFYDKLASADSRAPQERQ